MEKNQKAMLKHMIQFNHATFDNTYNAAALMQDQFERAALIFLDQTPWLTDQGRKAVETWSNTFKSGREYFKKFVDGNFSYLEKVFAD